MKAFFIAAMLFFTASARSQIGVAIVAVQSDIGTAPLLANGSGIGVSSFLSCTFSCTMKSKIFIDDETVDEGSGIVYMTISLAPSSDQTVSVNYLAKNGSAKQPKDYTKTAGTLEFQPGEAFKKIAISIVSDGVAEPQEEFFVELSQPLNAVIEDGSGKVTINDVPGIAYRTAYPLSLPFSAIATPNPSAGQVIISVSAINGSPIHLQVYDAVGRLVKTYMSTEGKYFRIGEDLRAGVYTVKVLQGANAATLKVVKL